MARLLDGTIASGGYCRAMTDPRVLLLGKPGCHLCDEAREIVERVCRELSVTWEERSILDDPELERRYGEQIPVTFVDGLQHDFWQVDEGRLRAVLTA
jgi:Glutaredoxin-like domain (DUF836)